MLKFIPAIRVFIDEAMQAAQGATIEQVGVYTALRLSAVMGRNDVELPVMTKMVGSTREL